MNNLMQKHIDFTFEQHAIRVVSIEGEPWFVAADVCKVLKLTNPSESLKALDEDEKGVSLTETLGGSQKMSVISESGLYALTLRCRDAVKPESLPYRLRKKVTSEILPHIRKTGSYGKGPLELLNDPAAMRGLLLNYSEKVLALEDQVSELTPKAEALDRIATATEGSVCITNAAKILQVPPRQLFHWLATHGWIYRRPSKNMHYVAYQTKLDRQLLQHKLTTFQKSNGSEMVCEQVLVTSKGLSRLSVLLPSYNLADTATVSIGAALL